MPEAVSLLAALYAGLAGSAHCIGMCGGIAAVGGAGVGRPLVQVPLFNLGRIASYAMAGAIGATLFGWFAGHIPLAGARTVVSIASALVLVLLGIYFLFGVRVFGAIEAWGVKFWKRLSPLAAKFLPVRTPAQALALGMLWGWLPCGLVYVMLPVAWATGGALSGALVMATFGLATAPAMMAIGLGSAGLRTRLRRPAIRRATGAILIISGLLLLLTPTLMDREHAGHVAAGSQSSFASHRRA